MLHELLQWEFRHFWGSPRFKNPITTKKPCTRARFTGTRGGAGMDIDSLNPQTDALSGTPFLPIVHLASLSGLFLKVLFN